MARLRKPYSGRQWRQRMRGARLECPLVDRAGLVTLDQARDALGLRTRAGVRSLIMRRVLEPCVCGDLDEADSYGATRSSVDREMERRRTATFAERVEWRIRAMLHYV